MRGRFRMHLIGVRTFAFSLSKVKMGAAASSDLASKHVVVVGGSFAGVHAAKEAASAGFRVTM